MKALRWIIPALIIIALVMLFIAPAFFPLLTYHRVDSTASIDQIRVEQEKLMDFGSRCVLMLPLMFIVWVVYAICGRKNLYRKSIAKLLGHLCLGLLAAVMAFSSDLGGDTPALFMKLFWACFPYGLMVVGGFALKLWSVTDGAIGDLPMGSTTFEREFGDQEVVTERGIAGWLGIIFLGLLCGVVGIICCPVILTLDVVSIVRNRRFA